MEKKTDNQNYLLETTNIVKRFRYYNVLKRINLKLEPGKIYGLFGPNGAGKTTLIKILAGIYSPTSGKLSIFNKNYNENRTEILSNLGVLLDNSILYKEFNLSENIEFFANIFGIGDISDSTDINSLIECFGLKKWILEPVKNLSKGMLKKADIIRLFVHRPSFLLLDEPFSSLDSDSIEIFKKILKKYNSENKVSILISSHNKKLLSELSHNMIMLKSGRVIEVI